MGRIILAIVLAIACTTLLDATGYTALSALPLIPLLMLFAALSRMNLRDLGLRFGGGEYWGFAIAHPLFVLGSIAAAAQSFGALDLSAFDPGRALTNIALLVAATFVMAVLTEEGFFRGWLWGALGKQGASPMAALLVSTAAFVLWHVSFVFLSGEFAFGTAQIPLFFANATLLGLILMLGTLDDPATLRRFRLDPGFEPRARPVERSGLCPLRGRQQRRRSRHPRRLDLRARGRNPRSRAERPLCRGAVLAVPARSGRGGSSRRGHPLSQPSSATSPARTISTAPPPTARRSAPSRSRPAKRPVTVSSLPL